MKEKICKCIANTLGNLSEYEVMKLIEIPPGDKMGDFALPCFSFSKVLRKNPTIIAKELKGAMQEVQGELGIEKLEAVNGYLNIFMNRTKYIQYWIDKMKEPEFGIVKNGSGKTICMDYSSPIIA